MAENTQTFEFESKKLLAEDQFESAVRLEAVEGKPIKKVLCIKALPKMVSSEKVGDVVSYLGKTAYNVVYLAEDGSLKSLYADADWQGKISIASENYYLNVSAQENVVTGSSSNEVTLSSLHHVEAYGAIKEAVSSVEGLGENYVTLQKTHDYERVVNFVSSTFNEVSEIEVSNKVDDVLYSNCEVCLDSATASIDAVTLEGRLFVTSYVAEGEEVVKLDKTIDFKEELAALSATGANLVDASVSLSGLKVTASVSDIDNKTNLVVAIELQANVFVFAKESATVLEDTFSLDKDVVALRECVLKENYESTSNVEDTFTSSFETELEVENLLFVSNSKAVVSEITPSEDGVNVALWVETELLCEVENKEKVLVNKAVPYSLHIDSTSKDDQIFVNVRNLSARLKSKTEVEVSVTLDASVKHYLGGFLSFVSQVEEGEDKAGNDATIRVYVVDGNEDIFAVAKKLNMRPEEILDQNPNAVEGLTDGTRLVVYSPLDIRFE